MNSVKVPSTALPNMNQTSCSKFPCPPYVSEVLPLNSTIQQWLYLLCPLCQYTPDRTSVFPVTTACVQVPGSLPEVERLCLMTGPILVTPALPTETVYKFHITEQGQGSFCFLPQISYSVKVKCPHEGSQPVWFSAAKYILTVAETTWKSINPAAMLVPLSSVTMSVLSDMGSLESFPIRLSHQAAEYTPLHPRPPDKLYAEQCLLDGNKLDLAHSTL